MARYSLTPVRRCLSIAASKTIRDVVIVGGARTPIGGFCESLKFIKAPKLGALAISSALEKSGVAPNHVDEVFMGCVVQAGVGQAPARQAALGAGLPLSVPCTTVNKVCASGMKSVMFAAQNIALGWSDCIIAGGMESMSNIPFYVEQARVTSFSYGHQSLTDGCIKDGLWDPYNDFHMVVAGRAR